MEVHSPESPIHSVKDFAIHIAVITLGILIALGLDGLREHLRERRLVRETRVNFHTEFEGDRHNSDDELKRVTAGRDTLEAIVKAMPELALQHPEELRRQLNLVDNPYYFFAANSWQAALSTGALAQMSPEEASAYADAAEGIRRYTQVQADALAAETHAFAEVRAHPRPSPDEAASETEALIVFYRNEKAMAWVCPQMREGTASAIRASAAR
jgi:hypothetical protein